VTSQNGETNRETQTYIRLAVLDDAPAIYSIFQSTTPADTTNRRNGIGLADVVDWIESATEQQPLFVLEKNVLERNILEQGSLNKDTLEQTKQLQAWCSLAPFYGLPSFNKTLEISLYVSPENQRNGLGKLLFHHIEAQQKALGFTHLIAYIYGSNLGSIGFFKKQGFEQWGFLPSVAESEGSQEDVVLLERRF